MGTHRAKYLFLIAVFHAAAFANDGCFNDDKCECFKSDVYEFQCPPTDNPNILIQAIPNRYMKIDCINLTQYNLDAFPNYIAGNLEYFWMRKCPMPDEPLKNTMDKFNITDVKSLRLDELMVPAASNQRSLGKEFFQGLPAIRQLFLSRLSIALDEDILENFPDLQHLYLDNNKIEELGFMFGYKPELLVLDLSRNSISRIPDGIFSNLTQLKQLHLWKNNLENLTKTAFSGLSRLRSLELSINSLKHLDGDTFSELTYLDAINLRNNDLRNISFDLFRNNLKLRDIKMGQNPKLILPDYLFANLTNLTSVNVESSNLEMIPENIFQGCINLTDISLEQNKLKALPDSLFASLKSLKVLKLGNNKLRALPMSGLFQKTGELEILDLHNNEITSLDEMIFRGARKLKTLNLRNNLIQTVNLNAFSDQKDLITLDLSHNRYTMNHLDIDGIHPFSRCLDLQELRLSHNLIETFPNNIINAKVQLKLLDLSYNQIGFVDVSSLDKISRYTLEINLSHNIISWLDFDIIKAEAAIDTDNYGQSNFTSSMVYLSDNYGQSNFTSSIVYLSDNALVCDCRNLDLVRYSNNELDTKIRKKVAFQLSNVICNEPKNLKGVPVKNLQTSQITCPYSNRCPGECTCYQRAYDRAVIIDCSYRNLTKCPKIEIVHNKIEVNLTGNQLISGPNSTMGYNNVNLLSLSANKIDKFSWVPPKIEVLKLDNNRLKGLDVKVIAALNKAGNLTKLTLSGNPWTCGCSAVDLQTFLKTKYQKVNISTVLCSEDNKSLANRELCKQTSLVAMQFALPILTVLLLAALVLILYFKYEHEIKVWMFSKNICMGLFPEEELDKDKQYDIFISYSHKDEEFVLQNLLPILESGANPFKICIHVRDWMPGEFIATQVTNSVVNSRRTLVVLSDNFVESVWGKLEFRTAHTKAIEENRARVIVVKYGELDETKLDNDLKTYLKTNTYVEWGKPWFWKKLFYALPHTKRNGGFYESQKHANIMLKIDDKFELGSVPVVHPESTPPVMALDPTLLKHHPLNFAASESPLINR